MVASSSSRRLSGVALLALLLAVLLALVPAGSPGAGAAAGVTARGAPGVPALPSGTHADYQLGGATRPATGVGIVVRDRTARPAPGLFNICYVNGFQTQPDARGFWQQRKRLVLRQGGRPVVDEAWGEWLLDLRTRSKRRDLARIVGRWVAGCARDGYDAVELDNLDSFTRSRGLLMRRQALAYVRLLTRRAHREGVAVAQKNLAGLDGRRVGFDLAIAESCAQWRECDRYTARYGDQVVMVEYRAADFRRACERHGADVPVVLRDRALRPSYRPRFC